MACRYQTRKWVGSKSLASFWHARPKAAGAAIPWDGQHDDQSHWQNLRAWMQVVGNAFAQDGKAVFTLASNGSITNSSTAKLGDPVGMAIFESGTTTYAAVVSPDDGAVQIINLDNPNSPAAAGSISNTTSGNPLLSGVRGMAIFESGTTPPAADASPLPAIKAWAGFSAEVATESQMLNALDLENSGDPLPGWAMTHLGKAASMGNITVEEFRTAVQYVMDMNAVNPEPSAPVDPEPDMNAVDPEPGTTT